MPFSQRNVFYLRVSPTVVLQTVLYLDQRHLAWLNEPVDPGGRTGDKPPRSATTDGAARAARGRGAVGLDDEQTDERRADATRGAQYVDVEAVETVGDRVMARAMRVLHNNIMDKLLREAPEPNRLGQMSKREKVDVHTDVDFQMAYFFRRVGHRHAVLLKQKSLVFPHLERRRQAAMAAAAVAAPGDTEGDSGAAPGDESSWMAPTAEEEEAMMEAMRTDVGVNMTNVALKRSESPPVTALTDGPAASVRREEQTEGATSAPPSAAAAAAADVDAMAMPPPASTVPLASQSRRGGDGGGGAPSAGVTAASRVKEEPQDETTTVGASLFDLDFDAGLEHSVSSRPSRRRDSSSGRRSRRGGGRSTPIEDEGIRGRHEDGTEPMDVEEGAGGGTAVPSAAGGAEEEEEEDKKPRLEVKYSGFRIFAKMLVLVIEPTKSLKRRRPELFAAPARDERRQLSAMPSAAGTPAPRVGSAAPGALASSRGATAAGRTPSVAPLPPSSSRRPSTPLFRGATPSERGETPAVSAATPGPTSERSSTLRRGARATPSPRSGPGADVAAKGDGGAGTSEVARDVGLGSDSDPDEEIQLASTGRRQRRREGGDDVDVAAGGRMEGEWDEAQSIGSTDSDDDDDDDEGFWPNEDEARDPEGEQHRSGEVLGGEGRESTAGPAEERAGVTPRRRPRLSTPRYPMSARERKMGVVERSSSVALRGGGGATSRRPTPAWAAGVKRERDEGGVDVGEEPNDAAVEPVRAERVEPSGDDDAESAAAPSRSRAEALATLLLQRDDAAGAAGGADHPTMGDDGD